MIVQLFVLTQSKNKPKKLLGAYERGLDYTRRHTTTLAAPRPACRVDLCLQKVSRHKLIPLSALWENIRKQLAERIVKYITYHLHCACSHPPSHRFECSLCKEELETQNQLPEAQQKRRTFVSFSSSTSVPQNITEVARNIVCSLTALIQPDKEYINTTMETSRYVVRENQVEEAGKIRNAY